MGWDGMGLTQCGVCDMDMCWSLSLSLNWSWCDGVSVRPITAPVRSATPKS